MPSYIEFLRLLVYLSAIMPRFTSEEPATTERKRLIVGISGASGVIYGVRLLEALQGTNVATHLVVSKSAQLTLSIETGHTLDMLQQMAAVSHPIGDMAASISSGSFKTMGMVILPCSMRSVGEIATSVTTSLLTRAADVVLKERRKLVLVPRETPMHSGHLRNLLTLSDMGAIIAPPVPAFYNKPQSVDDIINHTVGRVLDLFDIESNLVKRWEGK